MKRKEEGGTTPILIYLGYGLSCDRLVSGDGSIRWRKCMRCRSFFVYGLELTANEELFITHSRCECAGLAVYVLIREWSFPNRGIAGARWSMCSCIASCSHGRIEVSVALMVVLALRDDVHELMCVLRGGQSY